MYNTMVVSWEGKNREEKIVLIALFIWPSHHKFLFLQTEKL